MTERQESPAPGDRSEDEEGKDDTATPDPTASANKKRKFERERACDSCRRKKIGCDGSIEGKGCSNCIARKLECTYVQPAKRRGPPSGYIDMLEWKISQLEKHLIDLSPDIDLTTIRGPDTTRESFDVPVFTAELTVLGLTQTATRVFAPKIRRPTLKPIPVASPSIAITNTDETKESLLSPPNAIAGPSFISHSTPMNSLLTPAASGSFSSHQEVPNRFTSGIQEVALARSKRLLEVERAEDAALQKWIMKIESPLTDSSYHGRGSFMHMIRSVLKHRDPDPPPSSESTEPTDPSDSTVQALHSSLRQQYWIPPPWETKTLNGNPHLPALNQWPSTSKAEALIDAYFDNANLLLPLMNRVVFVVDYHGDRWRTDVSFARLCLMVFACGSRYLVKDGKESVLWYHDDIIDGAEGDVRELGYQSAGWRFLEASIKMGREESSMRSLEELGIYVLLCEFYSGNGLPSKVWSTASLGLKACVDIGVHSKAFAETVSNRYQLEMHKRVFWALIYFDRVSSATLGRPMAMNDEDFDIDYPLDVDDEYWPMGEVESSAEFAKKFVQPEMIHSAMSYFVHALKLIRLLGVANQSFYPLNGMAKSPDLQTIEAIQNKVAQLDIQLASWFGDIPKHLIWDPNKADPNSFKQICTLYTSYYFVQIFIHRPFTIPAFKQLFDDTILLESSSAVCLRAAHLIADLAYTEMSRFMPLQLPSRWQTLGPIFTAGLVLLGQPVVGGDDSDIQDVRKCILALERYEIYWRSAARMRDILTALINLSPNPVDNAKVNPPEVRIQYQSFADLAAAREERDVEEAVKVVEAV